MNHEEMKKLVEQRKVEQEKRYQDGSRLRLSNNVSKKMTTSMIAALSTFEENFGYLWGHNKKNLTPQERQFYEIWQDCRSRILDDGNANIRAVKQEISEYDCKWHPYKTEIRFDTREVREDGIN